MSTIARYPHKFGKISLMITLVGSLQNNDIALKLFPSSLLFLSYSNLTVSLEMITYPTKLTKLVGHFVFQKSSVSCPHF